MRPIDTYLKEINGWGAIFGGKPLSFPDDAREILDRINNDLSPENLHMDGEASPGHVLRRSRLLHGARNDCLRTLGK
jgi:hypothetical protein